MCLAQCGTPQRSASHHRTGTPRPPASLVVVADPRVVGTDVPQIGDFFICPRVFDGRKIPSCGKPNKPNTIPSCHVSRVCVVVWGVPAPPRAAGRCVWAEHKPKPSAWQLALAVLHDTAVEKKRYVMSAGMSLVKTWWTRCHQFRSLECEVWRRYCLCVFCSFLRVL